MASPNPKKKCKTATSSSAALAFSIESIMGPSNSRLHEGFSSSASSSSSRSSSRGSSGKRAYHQRAHHHADIKDELVSEDDELVHCDFSPEPSSPNGHATDAEQSGTPPSSISPFSIRAAAKMNNNNNNNNHNVKHNLSAASTPGGKRASSSASLTRGAPQASSSSAQAASKANSHNNNNNNNDASTSRLNQVECQLDNKDMWDKFHSLNTEMIITKTGRRMFPVMKVQFHNLDPNARYAVSMDIVPVDNKRYRYAYHKSCWQVAGKADPSAEPRLYPHPDSPFNGDLLSRQVISFEKVKLTNNEMDKSGHIILNSMHKYQPRVHLIELKVPPITQQHQSLSKSFTSTSSSSSSSSAAYNRNHHQQQQQQPQLDIEGYRTFVFPETVFTAVTAYQNQLITKMKIDKNPFAKGFRDSSRLSDLDRNDPFDYMGPLGPSGARFMGGPAGPGSAGGLPGSLEAAASHMDAYQLLASAANNPWYSAAAVVAAAGGAGGTSAPPNPFSPMNAAACSTAQAAQLQATQMWLAAFSACLSSGGGGAGPGSSVAGPAGSQQGQPPLPPMPQLPIPNLNLSGPSSSTPPTSQHHHHHHQHHHHLQQQQQQHNNHHQMMSSLPPHSPSPHLHISSPLNHQVPNGGHSGRHRDRSSSRSSSADSGGTNS